MKRLSHSIIYTLLSLFAVSPLWAGQLSPSDEETYMLELINLLRAKPVEEAKSMMKTGQIPDFVDQELFLKELKKYTKYQPLFFDRRMIEAARLHTSYQIVHGQGHFQTQGTKEFTGADIKSRLINSGLKVQLLSSGENAFLYAHNTYHGHLAFTVDWGRNGPGGMQEGRKHRLNLFSPNYNLAGIGIMNNDKYKAMTQTFATAKGRYAGGVAYEDKNGNSFYDPGEGISGVEISFNGKKEFTWESGAFTFPINGEGGKLEYLWKNKHQAYFIPPGSQNIKYDFKLKESFQTPVTYAQIFARDHKLLKMDLLKYFQRIKDKVLSSNKEFSSFLTFTYYNSQKSPVSIQQENSKRLFKTLSDHINKKIEYLQRVIVIKPIAASIELHELKEISRESKAISNRIDRILFPYKYSELQELIDCYKQKGIINNAALKEKLKNSLEKKLPIEVRNELQDIINSLN